MNGSLTCASAGSVSSFGRTGSCAAGSLVGKTGDLPIELTGPASHPVTPRARSIPVLWDRRRRAAAHSGTKPIRQPLQQCFSISSPLRIGLLGFYDPLTDRPIRRRQNHIHASDGSGPRLFDQADDAGQQFTIWIVSEARRSTLPGCFLRDFVNHQAWNRRTAPRTQIGPNAVPVFSI
jgi:hypothetical protein